MRSTLFILSLALLALPAWSYPEMVRHGYMNCTACHTNLVGGGLLNDYGRSLSRELLAQPTLFGHAPAEGDEQFLGGMAKTPAWLQAGGDVRLLQTFVESTQASKGRFLIMQVDLEALAQVADRVKIFASIGRLEPRKPDPTAPDFVTSARHWVEFALSPEEQADKWSFRLGRFMPAYGIEFAEHTFVTRSSLDFNPGQERDAGELSWVNDQLSVIATGILSQASGNQIKHEEGGILQVASAVGEKSKVGLNYYETSRNDNGQAYKRRIYGGFAHIGFSKQWYGLLEVDKSQGADQKWGLLETFKLGYEVLQGVHLIAVHEFANLNTENANPKTEAYSIGSQWFPKPHWDLYGLYRRERNTGAGDDFQQAVWLIAHLYL